MSRTPSLTFRQAVYSQDTEEVFIILLEISHDDLDAPIRICNAGVDITSNGNQFVYYPFALNLPDDDADSVPQAQLTIDNVDLQQVEAIRSIQSPPSVRIMVVLASTPNTIEVDFSDFIINNIKYDAMTITGTLTIEDFYSEPVPGDYFVPSEFPALF